MNVLIDKPNLISAQQLDESTVELKWSVSAIDSSNKVDTTYDYDNEDKAGSLELTRYRVFVSSDDFERENYEWPAQADYMILDSENKNAGVLFTIVDSPSTFECFHECIRNPLCSFATHVYSRDNGKYECHLKSNLTNLSALSGHNDDHVLERSHNSARILGIIYLSLFEITCSSNLLINKAFFNSFKDNQNQAILKNLAPNKKYKFKVMVYDSESKEWSELSDSSSEIDMTIGMCEFRGSRSVMSFQVGLKDNIIYIFVKM